MAVSASVLLVNEIDKFTQKCLIPVKLLETTNLKIEDYVALQTSEKIYICRIYINLLPVTCVLVDDIVTSASFIPHKRSKKSQESIGFPDSVSPIKVLTFDTINVKIIFEKDTSVVSCDKTIYEDVVRKILSQYVVGKKCVVNCSGLKLADSFHIHSIVISETLPENHVYGRLLHNSKVEIVDIVSTEQICQTDKFQHIQLGGMNDAMKLLKHMLRLQSCGKSCRVLITGPSGSGKSSLVKKFCSWANIFFIIIDGAISADKCDVIHNQFYSYLRMFPNSICILFIDHIDILAPYNLKQNTSLYVLVNLINCVKNLNVLVISAAVNKTNINFKVSSLFTQEVIIAVPSFQQRKEIVNVLIKSLNCDINSEKIAEMTPGFVGHDIFSLIKAAITVNKKTKVSKENDVLHLTDEDFEKALSSISPSVLKNSVWNMKVKPVYWKDIGGMFSIKQRLQMCVEWPLHNPELFKKVNLSCPHGVLLYGPPGCCKTTLARGLATECKANFFAANPAQIYSSYVGESEKNITELFYQARLCPPSIIFLDELDSLVGQRKLDKKCQGVGEKVLSTLLNEMDGFGTALQFQDSLDLLKCDNGESVKNSNEKVDVKDYSSDDVIVVAATNRPDLIDDALLRPGRFDVMLYVSPPNEAERESILRTLTEKMPVKSVDMKNIAARTDLFSGADLKSLCNEAAMNALRHDMSASYITEENFDEALKKIKPSITRQQIEMYEKLSSKYGTLL